MEKEKIKIELEEKEDGFFWRKIYWGRNKEVAEIVSKEFEEFLNKADEEIKQICTDKDTGRLKHIIKAEHFDLQMLKRLCKVTNAARTIAKLEDKSLKSILTSKSVLNYFNQPSTRTFLSFSMAEAHLGMRREEIRDLTTSSFAKGESDYDSLRNNSSYYDAIVCRHPSDYYDLFGVWAMETSDRDVSFINAGSGKREHPTQGLLDYYTIDRSLDGKIDGAIYIGVGDCLRSRVIHSDVKTLALHKDITAIFIAPPHLQIDPYTENYITERGVKVIKIIDRSLRDVLREIHQPVVININRVQDEHGGRGEYQSELRFYPDMLDLMAEGSILMHPLPKREEIHPALDFMKKNPKIMYWRMPRNGMWMRVALFAYVCNKDQEILELYDKLLEVHDKIERNK